SIGTTSSAPRRIATFVARQRCGTASPITGRATSILASTATTIPSGTRRSTRKANSSTARRRPAPMSSGSRRKITSSLSAWQDRLLAFYDANPDFIGPSVRRNEVVSFVKGGLKDVSISRTSFSWGIPVPNDAKHIMYVWIEALSVYLTGAGYPDVDSEKFRKYWPCSLHMVGKDIIRHHCVYWPAFL